ncbi:MAG: hypothetical protein JNL54_04165 [Kineosporiaceae bacterium]|nr:hypothetical protein [Kineosporiaceae bacterium]
MSTQRVVSFELDESARAQVHARLGATRAERARESSRSRRSALLQRARELGSELSAAVPAPASTAAASVVEGARSNAELAARVAALETGLAVARSRAPSTEDVDGVLLGLPPGVPAPADVVTLLDRARSATGDRRTALLAAARTLVADESAALAARTAQRRQTAVALEELGARAAGLEDAEVARLVESAQQRHDAGDEVDPAALVEAVQLAERAQERAAAQAFALRTLLTELARAGAEVEESSGVRLPRDGRLVTLRDRASRSDVGARVSFQDGTLHWHATNLDTPGAEPPGQQEALAAEQAICNLLDRALDGAARAGVRSHDVKNVPPDGATAVAGPTEAETRRQERRLSSLAAAGRRRRGQQRRELG